MLRFRTRPVAQVDAQEFAAYAYSPPYDIYDSAHGSATTFLEASNHYVAVVDGSGALWGFGCTGSEARVPGGAYTHSEPAIDVGVGMSPHRTGSGAGREFCSAILDYAASARGAAASATRFRVSVAQFNLRSLRVWEALDFREAACFEHRVTGRLFALLVREPTNG